MLRVCSLCLLCYILVYDALATVPPIPPGLTGTLLDKELLSAEPRSSGNRIPRDANQRWIHKVQDYARAQMVSQPSLLSPFRLDLPLADSDESLPVLVLPVPVFVGSCKDNTVNDKKFDDYSSQRSFGNTLNSHANTENVPNKSFDTDDKLSIPNVEDTDDERHGPPDTRQRNYTISNYNTNLKQVNQEKLFAPYSVYEQDEEDYVGPHQYHFSSQVSKPAAPTADVNRTQETKSHVGPDNEDDNKSIKFERHPNNGQHSDVNTCNAHNDNPDDMSASSPDSIRVFEAPNHTPEILPPPNVRERDNYYNKWNDYNNMAPLPTREVVTTRRPILQYAKPNIKFQLGPDDRDDYSPPLLFLPPNTSPPPLLLTTPRTDKFQTPLPYSRQR